MKEELFSAHRDLEDRHWWFRGRRRAIVRLGTTVLPPAGGRVVDVGCGTGADLAAFPAHYGRHGVDVSPTAVRLARRAHPGIDFDLGAAPDAGAGAIARADLVLLLDVLEHIDDDRAFLRGLAHEMAIGAHILLTVAAGPRLWSPHDEVYGHYRRYTRETLRSAWRGLPVEVRLLAPFNRRLYPIARLARTISGRLGRGWGPLSSGLVLPWAPVNTVLEGVFSGEARRLLRALENGTRELPGSGLSLLALLRRTAGMEATRATAPAGEATHR